MQDLGIKHFRVITSKARALNNGTSDQLNLLRIYFSNEVFDALVPADDIEP